MNIFEPPPPLMIGIIISENVQQLWTAPKQTLYTMLMNFQF